MGVIGRLRDRYVLPFVNTKEPQEYLRVRIRFLGRAACRVSVPTSGISTDALPHLVGVYAQIG